MKNSKKKIVGISVATLIAAAAIAAPAIYFGMNTNEKQTDPIQHQDERIINVKDNETSKLQESNEQPVNTVSTNYSVSIKSHQPIKYVAIGDQLSAGYLDKSKFDLRGKLENEQVQGLSFPAFLANYINIVEPTRVQNFTNLGISNSSISDWLYLLNEADETYFKNKNYLFFEQVKKNDKQIANPYQNLLSSYFGNFGYANSRQNLKSNKDVDQSQFANFINQLTQANLLTVTIGWNDFLSVIDKELLSQVLNNTQELDPKIAIQFEKNIEQAKRYVANNLKKLLKKLKEINHDLSVNVIGYPLPFLRLNSIISSSKDSSSNALQQLIIGLNTTLKETAKSLNVNFIATNDTDDWLKYNDQFAKNIFNPYPTHLGYKKMAQDVFLKLALGEQYNDIKTPKLAQELVASWDANYFNQDKDSFKQQIAFKNIKNPELIIKVIGTENASLLFAQSILEKEAYNKGLLANNKPANVLYNWLRKDPEQTKLLVNLIVNLTSESNINNNNNNNNNRKAMFNALFNLALATDQTRYLNNAISNIQNEFDTNDFDKNDKQGTQIIDKENFKVIFSKHLLDDQNLYNLLYDVVYHNLNLNDLNKTKTYFNEFISSFINPTLIIDGLLANIKNKFNLEEITNLKAQLVKILSNTKALDKIVNIITNEIFNNKEKHFQYKTLSTLISSAASAQSTNIEQQIDLIINTLTKDENNLELIYRLFLSSANGTNNNIFDHQEVKPILKKILMKGTELPLLSNYKKDIMNKLVLPTIYSGLLDLNQSHLTKQLAKIFEPGTQSFFDSMIKMFLNKNLEANELEKLTEISLQHAFDSKIKAVGTIGVVETITKSSNFNYFKAIKNMLLALDANKLKEEQKTEIKNLFKKVINKVVNSSFADKIFKTLEDYAKNKLGDLLVESKIDFVQTNGKDVWSLISNLASQIIRPTHLQNLLELALVDFVDNPNLYVNVSNTGELLQVLLSNKNLEIKKLLDDLINLLTKDEKLNKLLSQLATQYTFSSLPFKTPVTEQQKNQFELLINKLIPKLSNLTLFKNLKEDLLTSLKSHIPLLFSSDPNAFNNKLTSDVVNSLSAGVLTLLELVEDKNIKEQELIDITNLFLDHLDFSKIFKTKDIKPKVTTSLIENNHEKSLASNALNIEYKSTQKPQENTSNILFKVFNRLISLDAFNRDDQVQLSNNQKAANAILNNLIEKIFTNSDLLFGIKNTINGALTNSLLVNKLGLSNEQQVELVDSVFNQFLLPKNNDKVKKLIQAFSSTLINNAKELKKKQTIGAIFAYAFEKNKNELIGLINDLTDFVLKDKNVRQLVLGLLVQTINPNMNWNQLKEESKKKLLDFTNKLFDQLAKSRFIQTFKNNFNSLISNQEVIEKLLNTKDYSEAFNILTDHSNLVKEMFNFLADDQFSVREYVDILQIFVFEVLMKDNKSIIKSNQKQEVGLNSNRIKTTINYQDHIFKIVQSLLKTGLADKKSKDKLKQVIELFVTEVFTNKEHNTTLINWIVNLLKVQFKAFNNQANLVNATEDLIKQVLNSNEVKTNAVDLIKVLISDVLDHTEIYAKQDSFAALFETYAQRNVDNIKTKLINLANAIFKNKDITNAIANSLVVWFEEQFKATLQADEKEKVKSFVSTLLQKITDLKVYNYVINTTFEFVKKNARLLFEQNNDNNSFANQLKNKLLAKPEEFVNILEIFKINELETKQFIDVIDILFNPIINSVNFNSMLEVSNKNQETAIVKNQTDSNLVELNFFKQIIISFINNDLIVDNDVKTKINTIINHLLNKIFTSTKLQDEFANILAGMITKATNLPTTKDDYVNLFKSITTNNVFASELKTWVSDLVNDIANAKAKYRNLGSNQEIINTFIKTNLLTLKHSFIKVLTALVNDEAVQSNFSKAVISTLETYASVTLQTNEKKAIHNLLVKLIKHTPALEFTNYTIDQLIEFTTNVVNGINDPTKLINQLFNPKSVASLLQMFDYDDIKIDDLKVFVDIVIKYLPKIANKAEEDANNQAQATKPGSVANNTNSNVNKNAALETIFAYINALQTSKYLAKNHNVATKLYTLIEHLVHQVFKNEDLKTFITKNLFALTSNIDLSALSENSQNVVHNLISILYESEDFKSIIKTLAKAIILQVEQFKSNKNFTDFLSTLFNLTKVELKPQLVSLVQNIASSKQTQTVITNSLFELISNKPRNEIDTKSTDAVNNLVGKILGNAKQLPIIEDIIGQLVDRLASAEFVDTLLGNNYQNRDVGNKTLAINNLFSLKDPKKLASIVDILRNESISDDDYVNGFVALVNELDLNKLIKLDNQASDKITNPDIFDRSATSDLDPNKLDFGFEVVKEFITSPKEIVVNNRLVSIGTKLFNQLFSTEKTNGFAQNMMINLADQLAVVLANNVPELRLLKAQYQESFRKLFTNPALFDFAKGLLSKSLNSIVNNGNSYKVINNFADLLTVYLKNNKEIVKSEIQQFLNSLLKKDGSFVNELASIVEQTVINYFNLSALNESDHTKIKAVIKDLVPLLPTLDFFKVIPAKLLDFMQDNTQALLSKPQEFASKLQSDFIPNQILDPQMVVSLLSIFDKAEYINQIGDFISTILSKSPASTFKQLLDPIFNNFLNPKIDNTTRNKLEKNKPDKVTALIKAIIDHKGFQNLNIRTKLIKTIQDIYSNLLNAPGIIEYLGSIFETKLAPTLAKAMGIDQKLAKDFLVGTWEFLRQDQSIWKMVKWLIVELINNHTFYSKNEIKSFDQLLAKVLSLNQPYLGSTMKEFIANFLRNESTTRFIAAIMFKNLKLQNIVEEDYKIVHNLLVDLSHNLYKLDFVNVFIDQLYIIFKELQTGLFTKEGFKIVSEFLNAFVLKDPLQFLKIEPLIGNGEKDIKPLHFVNFINLIFDKSPYNKYSKLTPENNPLFYALSKVEQRNIWSDVFGSLKKAKPQPENQFLKKVTSLQKAIKGAPDPRAVVGKIMSKLWDAQKVYELEHPTNYIHENPFTKAIVRMGIAMLWYVHEMYFKGSSPIMWWASWFVVTAEREVYKLIHAGKGDQSEAVLNHSIFGARQNSLFTPPPNHNNYAQHDFLYMISNWHKNLDSKFLVGNKYVDDIFLALKKGHPPVNPVPTSKMNWKWAKKK